jgi:acetylornithine deacetylase
MDPAIRLLRDLVAINSVNPTLVPGAPGEAEIAGAIAAEMRRLGLDVETQQVAPGRPNTIGVLEGRNAGSTLMFCGHVDTVGVAGMTDPFTPVEKDGRLHGRGAQDMKGGVAAMIDAVRVIADQGGLQSGRLILAAVVDEEHSSIGADAVAAEWSADGAVVTEPTDLEIAVGHKGFAWVEVEVHGKAAHGSRPEEGEDAILRMGRVLKHLEALDRDLQKRMPHPRLGTGSLHASFIEGGGELTTIPIAHGCSSTPNASGRKNSAALDEVLSILEASPRRSIVSGSHDTCSAVRDMVPADHEPHQTLASIRHVSGIARFGGASFWTDAAVLSLAGIPSMCSAPVAPAFIQGASTSRTCSVPRRAGGTRDGSVRGQVGQHPRERANGD